MTPRWLASSLPATSTTAAATPLAKPVGAGSPQQAPRDSNAVEHSTSNRDRGPGLLPLVGWAGEVVALLGREEVGDHAGEFRGPFEEEQMPAPGHDVQPCVRDAAGEDPPVHRRDDGVVVAGEHQGRLPEPPQPGQTGPEADRVQLEEVAAQARRR